MEVPFFSPVKTSAFIKDLGTFTGEIFNGKLHFLCGVKF